ncbi:MAG: PHP domain-containing protein [Chloroflexi bacterium]|nr:MAG: PHP domain-containing protein [Chloroflexota bacterium]
MARKQNQAANQWYTVDLHLHTPASTDFQQPDATYIDILEKAESRGLDMIAFTDHNTVAGYRKLSDEIQQLELLEKLGRLLPEERTRLDQYRRLMSKILVLPGFEFTATFGFHILCIFPPEKPVRELEHLLLTLNIPPEHIDEGSQTVGATSDALTVYRVVNQHGGLVIAAHANSSNGVAMRGFNFGGQTKIAFTQDINLHALEVTDLEQKGPRSTAAFFNGTKPEYPRRMHCIQGSDAHRVTADPLRKKNLSIGDRATDVLMTECTFQALKEVFLGNDFSRTRPHSHAEEQAYDFIQSAVEEGSNIITEFHDSITVRGGKLYDILADVCAFANTNGGTLYLGVSEDVKKPPVGIPDPEQAIQQIEKEINNRISPPLHCQMDIHDYRGKKLVRVLVPRGDEPPYAVDDNKIYVRDEAETGLAVRDEIVSLVLRNKREPHAVPQPPTSPTEPVPHAEVTVKEEADMDDAPRTGVEVLNPEERQGKTYFTMRDLRNGNMVKNVTRASARKLWHYAINRYNELAPSLDKTHITWQGDLGFIGQVRQGSTVRYDLIQRTPGGYRFYFGVTADGIHGGWKHLIGEDEG